MDLRSRLLNGLDRIGPPFWDPAPERAIYQAIAELHRRAERGAAPPLSLDLSPYELRVFSQNGEDGVLDELVRRVGTSERPTFVEFGTEGGVQANCVYLADVARWHGHFIEAADDSFAALQAKYEPNPRVVTTKSFVTPEGIDELFGRIGVPAEPDVLSIDIDGHDYWVWEALQAHRPRIVVIEYNGALGRQPLVQARDSPPVWNETEYFGASATALAQLGVRKGYRHVYCDLAGLNAFFVRDDLADDARFLPPAEVAIRAPNFRLLGRRHRPGTGPYQQV
jgi:hypothetical protein